MKNKHSAYFLLESFNLWLKSKKYLFFILPFIIAITFIGAGCKDNTTTSTNGSSSTNGDNGGTSSSGKVELEWWGLWDDKDVFSPQIKAFQEAYPNIRINYRKLTFEEYEDEVISALATGKGPDIWLIHNTWLPEHMDKLAPMPDSIMTPDLYGEVFVDVALYDMQGTDEKLYGIPLSVDTLALYYNKDFFNTAGLTAPPATWTEFKSYVKDLTQVDSFGNIELAGASLGTSKNVSRAVDILYLLMLQNGTQMTNDDKTKATFGEKAKTPDGEIYSPGLDALLFYTDFADPKKSVYTWNPSMHNSLDAFIEEKSAMFFGCAYQDAVIKSKAPKLNYDIAYVPQIEETSKEINYANYWAEVVSTTSEHQEEAWTFLSYLSKKENVEDYCNVTMRPASRKDVIEIQLQDPTLKIFAKQALTARSWYQADSGAIEGIFSNLIESIALDEKDPEDGVDEAVKQVSNVMAQD